MVAVTLAAQTRTDDWRSCPSASPAQVGSRTQEQQRRGRAVCKRGQGHQRQAAASSYSNPARQSAGPWRVLTSTRPPYSEVAAQVYLASSGQQPMAVSPASVTGNWNKNCGGAGPPVMDSAFRAPGATA